MANTCSCDHVSIRTERTKEVWTPYERCLPLQCMQIKMPYVTLAHSGLASPQSQHRPLPGSDTKRRRQLRGNLAPSCGHTERILSSSAAAWATIAGAACSILVWWILCVGSCVNEWAARQRVNKRIWDCGEYWTWLGDECRIVKRAPWPIFCTMDEMPRRTTITVPERREWYKTVARACFLVNGNGQSYFLHGCNRGLALPW